MAIETHNKSLPQLFAQSLQLAFLLSLCFFIFFTLLGGVRSYWTDSEMWPVAINRHLFSGETFDNFSIKPLFNLLLNLSFDLSQTLDLHPMWTARGVFALNSAVIFILFYLILKKRGQTTANSLFVLGLLCCNSFVAKRMGHVRSDFLITTCLLSLTLFALSPTWVRSHQISRALIYFGHLIASLLFTPKALVHFAGWALTRGGFRLQLVAGLSASLTLISVVFLWFNPSVGSYALQVTKTQLLPFTNGLYWMYVTRFLSENFVVTGLFCYSLFGSVRRKTNDPDQQRLVDFSTFCFLLLVIYPERLPFFIASLCPFFYLAAFASPNSWPSKMLAKPWFKALIALYVLGNIGYWSFFTNYIHSSEVQEARAASLAEQLQTSEGVSIYDPVGILPIDGVAHWFVGPNEPANVYAIERMSTQKPEIILKAERLEVLASWALEKLNVDYYNQGQDILIKKHPIDLFGLQQSPCELLDSMIRTLWPKVLFANVHVFALLVEGQQPSEDRVLQFNRESLTQCDSLRGQLSAVDFKKAGSVFLLLRLFAKEDGPPLSELFRYDSEF